jgi:hypothetical protein
VFFWHIDKPLWILLLILFGAGFLVGSLFPWTWLQARRHAKEQAPAASAAG